MAPTEKDDFNIFIEEDGEQESVPDEHVAMMSV